MLNQSEKELVKFVLEKHLEEVQKVEKFEQQVVSLAAEVKYEDFVNGIIKKLNS